MAIIHITLNTELGDTLQKVVDAMLDYDTVSPGDPNTLRKEERTGPPFEGRYSAADSTSVSPSLAATTEPSIGEMDGNRKRGEAAPGPDGKPGKRRTNKQIAEDEAYFAQLKIRGAAALAAMEKGVEKIGTDAQLEHVGPENLGVVDSLISTGEPRIDPEEAAQDAADEAAESAERKAPKLEDLKRVVGDYQKKYGMAQAARRIPEILGGPVLEVAPKDIGMKMHAVAAAIEHDGVQTGKFSPMDMLTEPEKALEEKPPTATSDEFNAAVSDYAMKFDGTADATKWTNTRADIHTVFERLFGPGKVNFRMVDKTPENLGRALAAVRAEIANNTFGRKPSRAA